MNEKYNVDDLVLEYLSGGLSRSRKKELETLLGGEGYDISELREMAGLYDEMGDIAVPLPSEGLGDRFYAALEEEKRLSRAGSSVTPSAPGWFSRISFTAILPKLAYAALFILIGWTAGGGFRSGEEYDRKLQYMSTEVSEMKKMMMFSMLNRESASERLQAVQYLRDLVPSDERVLTAMLDVFERDPNVNVRLATLDALSTVEWDERIREGLISNIEKQDSPLIQLALVNVMVSSGERRALEPLRHLLLKKDLNMTVRSRINEGLRYLS